MRNIIRLVASIALRGDGPHRIGRNLGGRRSPAVGAVTCDHPESGWWTGTWTSTEHSYAGGVYGDFIFTPSRGSGDYSVTGRSG